MDKFEVVYLEDARQFLIGLDSKTRTKILYNIDGAKGVNDPKLFKRLNNNIWEFRTLYNGLQYRLLAFWDKSQNTLVVATYGFIKKVDKVPEKEIDKAESLREYYFKSKNTKL